MKRNPRLLFSAILIIIGGISMRFSWIFIREPGSPYTVVGGAVLFLAGLIWFAFTLFSRNRRF